MPSHAQSFAFLLRHHGERWRSFDDVVTRRRSLVEAERRLASDIHDWLEVRRLGPREVARLLERVPVVDATFLGPVFGGIEVTIDRRSASCWMEALAGIARGCGGPVVRLRDGATRDGIGWVSVPAGELCAEEGFGAEVLLPLESCDVYAAHVTDAVTATLGRAGVRIEYCYHGTREPVVLRFERYVEGEEPTLWQWLTRRIPARCRDCRTALAGHEFRVLGFSPALARDEAFWAG